MAKFGETRLAEVQLPNNLDQNPRRCAPSSATPALGRGSALSGSPSTVSGDSRSSEGASMAGIRSTRALCNQGYRICSLHFGPIAQELGVHGGAYIASRVRRIAAAIRMPDVVFGGL
jgi:hypothetical protein